MMFIGGADYPARMRGGFRLQGCAVRGIMRPMQDAYTADAPTREEVDAMPGPVVLEFGTSWCGWCRGAQPHIAKVVGPRSDVRHIKVEDGPGRPLGRSFRVKLWPTLVFLKDGREVARVTRPRGDAEIADALAQVA
jgi:thioredoxin 1